MTKKSSAHIVIKKKKEGVFGSRKGHRVEQTPQKKAVQLAEGGEGKGVVVRASRSRRRMHRGRNCRPLTGGKEKRPSALAALGTRW